MADWASRVAQRVGEAGPAAPIRGHAQSDDARRLTVELEAARQELRVTRARLVEAEARAEIDPLLDIVNRRGFERQLARAIAFRQRYETPVALIYLDLDDFKPVNDRYGHAVGDSVLKLVAATLVSKVRGSDVVARIGGDELAVLLWNLGEAEAERKAEELEEAVGVAAIDVNGTRVSVGASAGVGMLHGDDTPVEAIARADAAMYRRKAARKASLA
jgi:diguanylate cyclase (GGDEF)-like protein